MSTRRPEIPVIASPESVDHALQQRLGEACLRQAIVAVRPLSFRHETVLNPEERAEAIEVREQQVLAAEAAVAFMAQAQYVHRHGGRRVAPDPQRAWVPTAERTYRSLHEQLGLPEMAADQVPVGGIEDFQPSRLLVPNLQSRQREVYLNMMMQLRHVDGRRYKDPHAPEFAAAVATDQVVLCIPQPIISLSEVQAVPGKGAYKQGLVEQLTARPGTSRPYLVPAA